MQCAECEKTIKHEGPLCKSCHANAHCIRCKVKLKSLMSLCIECFELWSSIKEAAWDTFLVGISGD